MIARLALVAMFFLQPPEPGPDTPACNNFSTNAHKCACGKAMKCHDGKVDDAPDPAVEGMTYCKNYCKRQSCFCVGPCETHRRNRKKNA